MIGSKWPVKSDIATYCLGPYITPLQMDLAVLFRLSVVSELPVIVQTVPEKVLVRIQSDSQFTRSGQSHSSHHRHSPFWVFFSAEACEAM